MVAASQTESRLRKLILAFAFLVALTACGSDQETVTLEPRELGSTLIGTSTPIPQILETKPAACVNDARFVEDLTVPDGYVATPGDILDKRWAVINSGSCDWGADYRLVRIDDGPIDAPREMALYPARSGETGVWSIQIVVPDQAGDQVASWQAQSPDGAFFGDQVFVLVNVEQ